jgi:choline-sulfatase
MRILYIDIDSLRPDHLGCYGYHRETSPNIDGLAEDGRRFTNYYVSDAPCLPSRTALFSGRFGIHTGAINHGGLNAAIRPQGPDRSFRREDAFNSWPTVMADAGLQTAMISPFPKRHDAWHVLDGIQEYVDPGRNGMDRADEIYPLAESWLKSNATEDDWFLHVNLWDPHVPYDTPTEYENPFADDPPPEWITEDVITTHYEGYGPHSAREVHGVPPGFGGSLDLPRVPDEIASVEDFNQYVDGYDVGIHYMDHYVGKIVKRLREAGVFEETLIIVSADHGEQMGELNVYGDHQTADEATTNVPLIIRGPGVEPGVDRGLHYQVDLPPTIADLLDVDPPERWDGRSFADSVTDGASIGRDVLICSQAAWSCQRSVRWDSWLLLKTYHNGFKGAFEDVMLFDLDNDPHETNNLSSDRPDVVAEGLANLQQWHGDRMQEAVSGTNGGMPDAPRGVTDPMWEVIREGGPYHIRGEFEAYTKRLRETGREHHAEELERTHG